MRYGSDAQAAGNEEVFRRALDERVGVDLEAADGQTEYAMPIDSDRYLLLREIGLPAQSIHTFSPARYRAVRRRPEVAALDLVDEHGKPGAPRRDLTGWSARIRIEANRIDAAYRLEIDTDDDATVRPIKIGTLRRQREDFTVPLYGTTSTRYRMRVVREGASDGVTGGTREFTI